MSRNSWLSGYCGFDYPTKNQGDFARYNFSKRRLPPARSRIIKRDLVGRSWISNSFSWRYLRGVDGSVKHPQLRNIHLLKGPRNVRRNPHSR